MKTDSWAQTAMLIALSGAVGLGTGVIGTALTSNTLSEYAFGLSQLGQPLRVAQELPRVVPKNYEDALALLQERALPAVGALIASADTGLSGIPASVAQTPVIALTSDGWGLAPASVIGEIVQWKSQQCLIDVRVEDVLSGLSFVHCQAANVPVVNFGSGNDLASGDQLFVVSGNGAITFSVVSSITWGSTSVVSSDIPLRRIQVSGIEHLSEGSPAFNVFGDLVGVVVLRDGQSEIIPFEQLSSAFHQVLLPPRTITRPSLGVQGIDLSKTVGVSKTLAQARQGFLLYGPGAVALESAAAQAGLQTGDILLAVDGVVIDAAASLDDLLVPFAPGDQVSLTIERDGTRQEVLVTLGELAL